MNTANALLKRSLGGVLARMLCIAHSALREIFDESAYARFLERRQIGTSPEAYAKFLLEQEATRQRRPRCC